MCSSGATASAASWSSNDRSSSSPPSGVSVDTQENGRTITARRLPAEAQIPGFVYVIIASLFVAFNVFAITMVLQYRKIGAWRDYLVGEKTYMVLSLVAKSLLAWQVWSGTLRPQ